MTTTQPKDHVIMTSWGNITTAAASTTMTSITATTSDDAINTTDAIKDYVISEEIKERIIAISIIMACTVIGNLTLILILLCRRSRRIKRVNIFLINLAFGDLAVALFVNSTEILFLAFGDWVLGSVLCKVMVYVQMVCLASATNLLTAMTLDRYQVIVKPMETLAKRPRILLKIAIAWALSLTFPLPQLFIFVQYEGGTKFDGTPKRICGSKGYTALWQRKVYFTFTTTYILIVPMLIMLYCYARIIHVVWVRAQSDAIQHSTLQQNHHHSHHHYQYQHQHQHQQQRVHQRNKKGTKASNNSLTDTSGSTMIIKAGGRKASPLCRFQKQESMPMKKKKVTRLSSNNIGDNNKENAVAFVEDNSAAAVNRGKHNNSSNKSAGGDVVTIWKQNELTNQEASTKPSKKGKLLGGGLLKTGKKGSVKVTVRRNMMTSSKRRVLTMTLSVVMSFFVCHTPYFVLTMIRIYSNYGIKMETGQLIGEFMVMVHSTLNPLLYGLFTLRQKHLKYLLSRITCCFRSTTEKRRLSSSQTNDGNNKGEMHCLLRRPFSKTAKTKSSRNNNSGHCENNVNTSAQALAANRRTGSPSSISTSASSSSTSIKPSILSRFRRKSKTTTQKPVVMIYQHSSCKGERDESSVGESLLYSNSDALDVCIVTTTSAVVGDRDSSNDRCDILPGRKSKQDDKYNNVIEVNTGSRGSSNGNGNATTVTVGTTPDDNEGVYKVPSLIPNGVKNKQHRGDVTSNRSKDTTTTTNTKIVTQHKSRDRTKRNNDDDDVIDNSIVLANNYSTTLDTDDDIDYAIMAEKQSIDNNIIIKVERATINHDRNVPDCEKMVEMKSEREEEDVKEETAEKYDDDDDQEEIIPPVDFNSPWEDEFIIGGLSRV